MTSPLWLWRLAVALGAVAAGAIALAALSATRAVRLDDGALHALLDACRSYLLPQPRAASIAVVVLASLGVAVLALGARALLRELSALAHEPQRFDGYQRPVRITAPRDVRP